MLLFSCAKLCVQPFGDGISHTPHHIPRWTLSPKEAKLGSRVAQLEVVD